MADTVLNTIKAAIVPVVIKRGDTTVFTIPLYDPNNNNDPVDLSVYVGGFRAQVKVDEERTDKVIELLSSAPPEIVASGHELTFTITSTKAAVKYGRYVWDVEGLGAAESPQTIIEGTFEVSQDVSR